MPDLCAHCGYERVKSASGPIAFCQTPKCAGNPWGGTDDGQLDPQPTRVMEQPVEEHSDQQSFGDRVIEKAVGKARDGIAEKVEQIHEERYVDTSYEEVQVHIGYMTQTDDDTVQEIMHLLKALEEDGRIALVSVQHKSDRLKKGTNDDQ